MRYFLCVLTLTISVFSANCQNIYRSACDGNLERVDSMLAHTDINAMDFKGRTLLHWAVACKQKDIFKYLLEKGIDINAKDHQGKTPMYMCVRFDNTEYFDMLLQLQQNDQWKEMFGASLLEKAVLSGNVSFLRKLIETGIDVDSKNEKGSTALEIAERIGDHQIVSVLKEMGADESLVREVVMKGSYMGQYTSDVHPTIFAPNFISTEEYEFGSVFNKEATEFYFGVALKGRSEIRYTKLQDGVWTEPEVFLSHEKYGYNDPFLSPDENRLYFISQRPLEGVGEPKNDHDIWYVEKENGKWSEPINAGPNINSSYDEYYISFTRDGTMYFASDIVAPGEKRQSNHDIYSSKFVNGKFQPAIRLGDAINTNNYEADVFIDPDEEYIIFCAQKSEGLGRGDLYISFKLEDGSWTEAANMGSPINTVHHELCPFVTHDGQYFFYTSNEDIYWVGTEIIDRLRAELKK